MNNMSLFDLLPEEEAKQYKPLKSTDWKWWFKDYPKEKNGIKVFSCFACGGGSNEEVEDEDGEDTHLEPRIICNEKFFEHLHMKRLVIDDRVDYPMSTLERVIRYAKYGYFPCRESKIKLAKAINELPPERVDVSESLYDGVD